MSTSYQIESGILAPSQDFNWLKNNAISYIQENIGNNWTNFNPSDPGLAILDQLCFALSELGYCTDFPIADLLTTSDLKLRLKDQFFKANEILTSAPITINDIKRCVIENIKEVDNLEITATSSYLFPINGAYKIWLSPRGMVSEVQEQVKENVYLYLNKIRNVGDLFLKPEFLKPNLFKILGEIELSSGISLEDFLNETQEQINNYIFQKVVAKGYDQLKDEGIEINDIYNGPDLKKGWILENDLVEKRNSIGLSDLTNLINENSSIISVSLKSFTTEVNSIETKASYATSETSEIIVFDLLSNISSNESLGLKITMDGDLQTLTNPPSNAKKIVWKSSSSHEQKPSAIQFSLDSEPSIPKGNFRNIEEYYSIQNTFPEIYKVGYEATNDNSSNHQIALSRQLKGYLSLFDQVLANQFSQLGNVYKLLSFKNSLSADPANKKEFYEKLNEFEKEHLQYPVPYLRFSPTYFYQSIYDAPNIQSLLKGFESFNSEDKSLNEKSRAEANWRAFQENPYNSYIHGLMQCMESNSLAYARRNEMLNHLLARHGQSPNLIDAIISGSEYSVDPTENKIIFKSLYLQNFAVLNYCLQSAYSFLGASPIVIPPKDFVAKKVHDLLVEQNKDFIFRAYKIDALERVSKKMNGNFYGIALKFNLLLGMRSVYINYISSEVENLPKTEEENTANQHTSKAEKINSVKVSQALWFMEQKGALFLETGLLLPSAKFKLYLEITIADQTVCKETVLELSYEEILEVEKAFIENKSTVNLNEIVLDKANPIKSFKLINTKVNSKDFCFKEIVNTNVKFAFQASWGSLNVPMEQSFLSSTLLVLVPEFIEPFLKTSFRNSIDFLMESSLAPSITYDLVFIPNTKISGFLNDYVNWFNSMIYPIDSAEFNEMFWLANSAKRAQNLSTLLLELIPQNNNIG